MTAQFQLAEVNIARALAPMEDPLMAGFVARLDDINALADASPGFIWRLKTEDGNATSLQPYDDPRIIINISVWESPGHLKQFVFGNAHKEVMRQRKQWFAPFGDVYYALWWVPAGHIPTVDEAKERLRHLRINGETEYSFSFASLFTAEGAVAAR